MKVIVGSDLGGCPEGCPNIDLECDEKVSGGRVIVYIGCSHSSVCKFNCGHDKGEREIEQLEFR